MALPKVSICIPAYKQVEYLKRTLQSVQSQTYRDYEIIVTDDSPDDSVLKLVQAFDWGHQLKYYKNARRLGSPENWNEAVRKASGEYIKMLHHDDWFTGPESLEAFVHMLEEHPEADFAFSSAVVRYAGDGATREHHATSEQIRTLRRDANHVFLGNFIGPPSSTIYRRSVNLQYDPRLIWFVDIDFYIQVLQRNATFVHSRQLLITSTTAAAHQITNDCVNNKCLELFETLYLYNKLKIKKRVGTYRAVMKFLFAMLERYGIRTMHDAGECNLAEKERATLKLLLFMKRLRLKRIGLNV
jgi:glycosyltransferase involved in cell wall biosynthesis